MGNIKFYKQFEDKLDSLITDEDIANLRKLDYYDKKDYIELKLKVLFILI